MLVQYAAVMWNVVVALLCGCYGVLLLCSYKRVQGVARAKGNSLRESSTGGNLKVQSLVIAHLCSLQHSLRYNSCSSTYGAGQTDLGLRFVWIHVF